MAKVKERARADEAIVEEVEGKPTINDFISNNQNLLLVIGGIILLVIVGLIYLVSTRKQANIEANNEMFNAIYYFEEDSLNKALNGDGINASLLDIVDEFGSSDAGDVARYYAGVAYLKQGQLDAGISELEAISAGNNTLGMATYVALGFAYEDQGDPGKAASFFEKAASTPAENDQTTPLFLLHAGMNYEADGSIAKARSAYQKIKDAYPNSTEAQQIDKYLGRVAE